MQIEDEFQGSRDVVDASRDLIEIQNILCKHRYEEIIDRINIDEQLYINMSTYDMLPGYE